MSKSILIKGADFSQNGFINPVITPEIIGGGIFISITASVGQSASDALVNNPAYKLSAVAKFRVQSTDVINATVDLNQIGGGVPLYFITNSDDEIIFISNRKTTGNIGTVRPHNSIISDIPQNAEFIYYMIDLGQNYSFKKEI